jgi:ubiquinone biosynthesis protein
VHAATLRDGTEVVVKVLRPDIDKVIRRDVEILYYVARLANRYWGEARRLRPVEVVAEYEKTIFDELDLMREAANGSQLRRNFADSDMLYVPEVHWPLTSKRVMVMERIHGTPISEIGRLREQGTDFQRLAEMGVEIFFTQVFKHNFFHADMHPGNIFVADDGTYIAVDFGIVGTLNPSDQRYLAENFVAFFQRDYRRVAELHVESEWVPEDTRVDEFESAIRAVCEPIFERPLSEISFGHLLLRLFQTARRFNMEVQPQLVLLQKTLLNIEGLGRQLYPQLDLWTTAKPFLEASVKEQMGARALLGGIKKNLPTWGEKMPQLPGLVHDTLQQLSEGRLQVQWRSKQLDNLKREVRKANQRNILAITGGACIIGASITLGLDGYAPVMLGRAPLFSWLMMIAGIGLVASAWPRADDD